MQKANLNKRANKNVNKKANKKSQLKVWSHLFFVEFIS
jgi:hypothetical protein